MLAAVEAAAASRRAGARYKLGDLVSGLGCGTLDQIVNLSVGAGFIAVYAIVESHAAMLDLPATSGITWVAAVLLHDLAYYLFHRASHRVNVLWAAHAVHHQSEDYTFAVSLRQGAIATWISYAFYLPLALLGIPVELFVIVHGAYQVYQFFVHTRFIPALGPLEKRAGDAGPPPRAPRTRRRCLDKNYGGFFIFWDKLFGSFAPYTREPDYGVTGGITELEPVLGEPPPVRGAPRRARRAPDRRDRAGGLAPPAGMGAEWDARDAHARLREPLPRARRSTRSSARVAVAARWRCCGRGWSRRGDPVRARCPVLSTLATAPPTGIAARGPGVRKRSGSA